MTTDNSQDEKKSDCIVTKDYGEMRTPIFKVDFKIEGGIRDDLEEQPPPTYELALKMLTKESSIGALPNSTVIWTESDISNENVLPRSNTMAPIMQ